MKKFNAVLVWCVSSLIGSSVCVGQIVQVSFAGTVNANVDQILGIGAGNNTAFEAYFQYDISTPDANPADLAIGEYTGAVTNGYFKINGQEISLDFSPTGGSEFFAVVNSSPDQFFFSDDLANATFTGGTLIGTTLSSAAMSFTVRDSTGTVLSSDALIQLPTTGWDYSNFVLTANSPTVGEAFTLLGTIDLNTLESNVIPEPSTYALLIGTACLGFVVWKRIRQAKELVG